jgi:thiol-disulfide isomerase/thioredoxin
MRRVHGVDPAESEGQQPSSQRRPLTVVVVGSAALAATAVVALLVFGVLKQSPNTTIDDSLARGQPISAPSYRLTVLRRGNLGQRLEPPIAPSLADGWVSPKELRGIPYVLNIWASWCAPCREEAPRLVREWRRARTQGVLFVGLDMQDTTKDARDFMDEFDVDYLNIRDPTNATSRRYGATGLPETFFVSARGDVVGHAIGVVTTAQLRTGLAAVTSGHPEAAQQGGARRSAR